MGVRAKRVCLRRQLRWQRFWKFGTRLRDAAIKHASAFSFIVPNPFKSKWGITKSGKRSQKTESQVLERRFTIVEFD